MPTSLTRERHIAALAGSGRRLLDLASAAGDDAPVPTCPAWDVRALVAHQSMVHRWATAHVTGADPSSLPGQTEIRRTVADLPSYYSEGLRRLVEALDDAAPDLTAMTFLNDAPAAREFWARRQAHETTVHMIDALAASLGRPPTAVEAAIDVDLAVDGIDELLSGFFTRGGSRLYDGERFSILVSVDDGDRHWNLDVAESLTVSTGSGDSPRLTISGPAAAVYLGLWNRGEELTLSGDASIMERWRRAQRVRWG